MELTYPKVGDYYIPDLNLTRTRRQRSFTASAVITGRADDHLTSIEREAERRMDSLLPQMMKAAGVTEELKARDQMAWLGWMNNCQIQADEIVLSELVYC